MGARGSGAGVEVGGRASEVEAGRCPALRPSSDIDVLTGCPKASTNRAEVGGGDGERHRIDVQMERQPRGGLEIAIENQTTAIRC